MHSSKTFLVVGNRFAHKPLRRDFTEKILQVSWLPLGAWSFSFLHRFSVELRSGSWRGYSVTQPQSCWLGPMSWAVIIHNPSEVFLLKEVHSTIHWPLSVRRLSVTFAEKQNVCTFVLSWEDGAVWVMLSISVPPNSAGCVHAEGSTWFYLTTAL